MEEKIMLYISKNIKNLLTVVAFLGLVSAQSVVTFDLDGVDECGFVSVTGTWDGWSGWGANTDTGMAASIAAGTHEFVILCVNTEGEWWNNIWGSSTVYNAPIDGSCWNGNAEYPNYVLNVDGSGDAVTVSYCAGSCDATCGGGDDGGGGDLSSTVTFDIDGVDDCGFVSINGSFPDDAGAAWSGWGAHTDNGMQQTVASGSYEFQVLCVDTSINEWWNNIIGASTVLTAPLGSECDFNPADEWNNYGFTVDGSGDAVTVSYCAGSCDAACSGDTDISGCLDANATNYNPDATVQEEDQWGNLVCVYASCDDTPGDGCMYADGWGAFNDSFDAAACSSYGGTPCEESTTATVEFSADMNSVDQPSADYDNVVINGSWNGWGGWGVQLFDDDGDGVFTGSAEFDAGSSFEYVVAVTGAADGWSGWGMQWGQCDGTNFSVTVGEAGSTTSSSSAPGDCGAPEPTVLAGAWRIAPEANALMVGEAPNFGGWWSNSAADVDARACLFDDEYVFGEDGSFNNVQGTDTWLEGWQGAAEGCGAPVAPHDGSANASYSYDDAAGTVTVNGTGAFLGLAKVYNGGECSSPDDAAASITYDITLSDDAETMTLVINFGPGFWTYKLRTSESIDDNTVVSGCLDPNATNYDPNATDQLLDQYGNLVCTYASCDDVPYDGCMYADAFAGWNEFFGPDDCTNYGGTPCEGGTDPCADVTCGDGQECVDGECVGGGVQIDLPVDFEGSTVNYTMTDFGGNASSLVTDPDDTGNMAIEIIKADGAEFWAGTTIGTPAGFATNIPLSLDNSIMAVRVWSSQAGTPIRLKVEDSNDPTHTCETETNTTVSGWQVLEFDFENQAPGTELLSVGLGHGWTYNMASIFFNFGTEGAGETYYFDDVQMCDACDGGGETVEGCMDPNATNYDADATVQAEDQWGNLLCTFASCDDVPSEGCMYADSFAPWNEFFGPADCVNYGGTPCEDGGGGDLSSEVTFDLDGLDECGFVSVTGTWDGWSGWGANTDTGMAASIPAGTHEFVILCVNTEGEWWNNIWGSSTVYNAPIDGSCWNGNAEYPNYVLNVDGSGDAVTVSYCAGSCEETCSDDECTMGDVNGDDSVDVLDIVQIVGYVISGEADFDLACADSNGDGDVNVLDIVQLVNAILGRSDVGDATTGKLIRDNGALMLEANGYIGGVQMTLKHGVDFTIELTDNALVADSRTVGNETKLVIVAPEGEELFTFTGDFEIVDMIVANSEARVNVGAPTAFSLSEAYPNPFNPITSMTLAVPEAGNVSVQVYNIMGQVVATLASGHMDASTYTLTWDASDVSSGMYFVKAEAAGSVTTQKLVLMK